MNPLASLVLLSLMSLPLASPARADEPPPLLVFVGEQLDFAELPDPCEDPHNRVELIGDGGNETACVVMDAAFWARYRVRETVLGIAPGDEVEFLVADHHGIPDFARSRTALLFVTLEAEGASLLKYQGYAVHATADGDWAMCGDPYPPGTPAVERRVVPLEFANGLGFADVGTLGPMAIADFDPAIYERRGERMFCRRGVRLMDLFDYVARHPLAGEGFDFGLLVDDAGDEPPATDEP